MGTGQCHMGHTDQLQDARTSFMYLATVIKDNSKSFPKYTGSKRREEGNLHPFLGAECVIVSEDDKSLRYLVPSLPQSLIPKPVVLRIPNSQSWNLGMGTRVIPP